ncbi:hypothetical protein ACPUVO_05890 [Pseudocolwellia sp. HL-MZ19]|uniref:hypothetical protein n=1 Tax=unclassified Pseudocolwellia TaxID=2848178 RepID=UPI003CE8AFB3
MYKFLLTTLLVTFSLQSQAQDIDPTKPLSGSSSVSKVENKKSLTLETIIYSDKNKSAIISGKLMKLGDYIGEHELIIVNASHVILRLDEERIKLSMFSNIVTK